MSVMVMSHREVDGFVDSFAPSQQTLGMEKGRGSTRHVTSEATRGLARVSHHLSQNRMKRGEGCRSAAGKTPASCASKLR